MTKLERGLGRGLDALLSSRNEASKQIEEIDIASIIARENQPRKNFDQTSIDELALSIQEHGVLQPIILRNVNEKYEIVAGERRWRAVKQLNMSTIPAIVSDFTEAEMAEISLIENIHREDIGVIDEALAYKVLLDRFNYTQEKLAERIGKSRVYITNIMRLLKLPAQVISMLEKKIISPGHARPLLALPSEKVQIMMAEKIVANKLSVRETEALIKKFAQEKPKKMPTQAKDPEILEVEDRIQDYFGTKAQVSKYKKGGKIEIYFYNDEDFERIIESMGL